MLDQRSRLALAGALAAVAVTFLSAPAGAAQPYAVDSFVLGERVQPGRDFQCATIEQTPGFTWCQRQREERGKRSFNSTVSMLRNADGAAVYLSRNVEPAFFSGNDIPNEIARLSSAYFSGERAREIRLPQRDGLPTAVIAVWGKIKLEQLDDAELAKLAADEAPRQNMLVDYLGDLRRSAQLKLPVFRLGGGAGYLWSASMQANGRGHLRFLAADASLLVPKAAPKIVSVHEIKTKPVVSHEVAPKQVVSANPAEGSIGALTAPLSAPAQQFMPVPVGEIPANTTVRAKSGVEHTGSIRASREPAPTAPVSAAGPAPGAKDQAAFGRTAAERPVPAQSDRMQTLIFSIGIIAIVLFALALLLERWSREPTGLELIEWQKHQDSAQARPVRDAARRSCARPRCR